MPPTGSTAASNEAPPSRCEHCRHWERGPDIRLISWLPATQNEWGECVRVVNDGELAYVEAYGCDDRPEFNTRDVFGCVLFQPVESALSSAAVDPHA